MPESENEVLMRFANETGAELFELLVTRAGTLGTRPFKDMLGALMGATAVCLANVLRPAVESAPDRALAADELAAMCARQARIFLGPVVAGGGASPAE